MPRPMPTVDEVVYELKELLSLGYRPRLMARLEKLLTLQLVGGPADLETMILRHRVDALREHLDGIARDDIDEELGVAYRDAMIHIFDLKKHAPVEEHQLGPLQAEAAQLFRKGMSERTFRDEYRPVLLKYVAESLIRREAHARSELSGAEHDLSDAEQPQPPVSESGAAEPTPREPVDETPPTNGETSAAAATVGGASRRRLRSWQVLVASAATVLIAVVVVLAVGSGSRPTRQRHSTAVPPPQPRGQGATTPTQATGPQPTQTTAPPPPPIGLSALADQHRLSWPQGGPPNAYALSDNQTTIGTADRVGTVSMGGRLRLDAISNRVYADNSNFYKARIQTSRQFQLMRAVVGINDATECPANTAIVHIEDERGGTLWGPREVSIRQPIAVSASIKGALQVTLVQGVSHPNPSGGDVCGQGDADPAWGNVRFSSS